MASSIAADNLPDAVAVDPRGRYVYVANYNANNVKAYTIDQSTGIPTPVAGSSTYAVGTGPICILIEPNEGTFIYTANFLGNSVSGLYLNPSTGALSQAQRSPSIAASQPTCAAAIKHNAHSLAE
jgi:6-phosphogluconolactonase (cycloisomerase 2 family)